MRQYQQFYMMEPNIFWVCSMKTPDPAENFCFTGKGDRMLQTTSSFYRENKSKRGPLSANYILRWCQDDSIDYIKKL